MDKNVLILGATETGKHALFKRYYHFGNPDKDSAHFVRDYVGFAVLRYFGPLLEYAESLNLSVSPQCIATRKRVVGLGFQSDKFTVELCSDLMFLWNEDPAVQCARENKSDFHYYYSLDYFMPRLEKLCSPDFFPAMEDWLHVYWRNSSIYEVETKIKDVPLKLYLLPGQRWSRKQWICGYENVDCVLFVVNLSCFNRRLYEVELAGCMTEDLELFDKTVNEKRLEKSNFCVFFNQRDLFREKIEASTEWPPVEKILTNMYLLTALVSIVQSYVGGGFSPLSKVFPEYNGGADYDRALEFIQTKFSAVDRRPSKVEKPLLTFVSCMLKTEEVEGL